MSTEEVSREIVRISKRLAEIEEEREALSEEALSERTDLLDEEHELNALLAELRDSFSSTQDVMREQPAVDRTRPPVL